LDITLYPAEKRRSIIIMAMDCSPSLIRIRAKRRVRFHKRMKNLTEKNAHGRQAILHADMLPLFRIFEENL
jgi:hypothetical protein